MNKKQIFLESNRVFSITEKAQSRYRSVYLCPVTNEITCLFLELVNVYYIFLCNSK